MEKIIGLLKSYSTSLSQSSNDQGSHSAGSTTHLAALPSTEKNLKMLSLETLPAEIILHVLSFLPDIALARVSATSRVLRTCAHNELLWMRFVQDNVPSVDQKSGPSPAETWRELYVAHYPHWFLPRHKLWFSDKRDVGDVIVARYNHKDGSIQAFRLLATHGLHSSHAWDYDTDVHIHHFAPELRLWLDDPVVKLDFDSGQKIGNYLRKEIEMQTGSMPGLCSLISLCQPIPGSLQHPSMSLWPPAIIPAVQRVRNLSPSKFGTDAHRPQSLAQISDRTFRIRRWMEFSFNAVRMGEEVMTYSSLLADTYTPTKAKPWQGIWVGDYSAHGCEFLLVLQRDDSPSARLSRRSSTAGLPSGAAMVETVVDYESPTQNPVDEESVPKDDAPTGRIEAIKLTGDVNVPRGECTWFADDIGDGGFIRTAEDETFKDARIVKSMGHIAGQGFNNDRFIPSQLIMISHDLLAQYWERFGHISYYKRVDIDALLQSQAETKSRSGTST